MNLALILFFLAAAPATSDIAAHLSRWKPVDIGSSLMVGKGGHVRTVQGSRWVNS